MSPDFDIAIVGCGPVGALAATLLGKAGLRTLIIEREADPHPLPRAVHIDHEMMRLFQAAGVLTRVLPDMRETDGHLHVGADHRVLRYMGTAGKERPFGWANDYFFYQPELEAHLRDALSANPNVKLALGVRFETLEQDASGVTLTLRTAAGADQVRAKWVIGCDGARSAVRKALCIDLDDLNFEEPWLVVDAELDGPVAFPNIIDVPADADLQRLSVMMCDPRRPTTVVPGRGTHRRWEFMLLPGESDDEMMRPEKVEALLSPWVRGASYRLVRAATYRFHGLVARDWSQGRVFLAGDAAHQTPPFFGQGMCHGLRDVANLAWRLALVESGGAPETLLGTYQAEREPHVRSVISAAVDAGRYICVLDPSLAAARDADIRGKSGPETAAEIIPALSAGVVRTGRRAAGVRFIQPWIQTNDGRALLDDATGHGWRLFVRDHATAALARLHAHTLPALNITIVNAADFGPNNPLVGWMEQRQFLAVLVRPDFYVFGGADSDDDLPLLLSDLTTQLSAKTASADPEKVMVA